jgi:hypothetical protein
LVISRSTLRLGAVRRVSRPGVRSHHSATRAARAQRCWFGFWPSRHGGWGCGAVACRHGCPCGWTLRCAFAVRVAGAPSRVAAGRVGGKGGGGVPVADWQRRLPVRGCAWGARVCAPARWCGLRRRCRCRVCVIGGGWTVVGRQATRARARVRGCAVPRNGVTAFPCCVACVRRQWARRRPACVCAAARCRHGVARAGRVLRARSPPPVPSRD